MRYRTRCRRVSDRPRQAGLSLVELLVATGLSGVACCFVFWIAGSTTLAYRTQSRVSELQQTLRSAGDLITRDLRSAGFMISTYRSAPTGVSTDVRPFAVGNGVGTALDDMFTIAFADAAYSARVSTTGPAFQAAETEVDTLGGFVVGDVVLAIRTANPQLGQGCMLKITGTQVAGPHFKIQHQPGLAGDPYNEPGNNQCDHISAVWNDGYTTFVKMTRKAYRIRPSDQRGVLEMSPSGGMVAGDWVELALGIVDLQVALRIYQAGDIVDADLDGDPVRDWYSGDNMNTILATAGTELTQMKVSLVARTTTQVSGVLITKTPDLTVVGRETNNDLGDHAGTTLPVTNTASRYYGEHLYRWSTSLVDSRNMGVGI